MGTASPTFKFISSESVEGTIVYDPSGNKIGEIDHLMIEKKSGSVRYAVMSFGGFMGLGHSHYHCLGMPSKMIAGAKDTSRT